MGIQTGDHVGLCAPNSGDWLAFYFGVLKAGAVAVTLSSQLKKDELDLLINHSRPRMIFTFDERLEGLSALRDEDCLRKIISPRGDMSFKELLKKGSGNFRAIDRERTDTAAILYTGGTTGTPKGVMLSHENINAAIYGVILHERSEAFWDNGWFRSGDVGMLDEGGYLYIVDRLKDMIITGGENVYSLEVEDVLYTHPDVQECIVIGSPDKEWGEIVTAFIIPQPNRIIDEKKMKDFLKSRLSAYKVPKLLFSVDDFPRSPAGKILKRKMRNRLPGNR